MSKQVTNSMEQTSKPNEHAAWLANFIEIYQQLSTDNLYLLGDIYHQDIIFIDPMHQLSGFDHLRDYFSKLYQQLSYCEFKIDQVIAQDSEAAVYWTMSYQHPRLNAGNVVHVQGSSHIKGCADKVIYHRDYLDLGAMLYEQLPLFGRIVSWFKHRASA